MYEIGRAGRRLRELRLAKRLSQQQVADLFWMPRERYNRIENARIQAPADEFLWMEETLLGLQHTSFTLLDWGRGKVNA